MGQSLLRRSIVCVCWFFSAVTFSTAFSPVQFSHAAESKWVWRGSTGRLVYQPDAEGDRIMDFSNVGYKAGKEAIPFVPTTIHLSPVDGDDTAHIQAAIDQIAALPIGPDGFRGAVQLGIGHYDIEGQIQIKHSGIVLRGEGRTTNDTVLHARGTDRRPLISVGSPNSWQLDGPLFNSIEKSVPVGMNSMRVDTTAGLAVNDLVTLSRPSTVDWIRDIGMESLGWSPTWPIHFAERTITRIEGDRVFFDAPLVNSLERRYGGATLQVLGRPDRIQHVGIENLRGESDYTWRGDEDHAWDFVYMDNVQDAWVRETKALGFAYAHVNVERAGKWLTVEDAINHLPASRITGSRRYTFNVKGERVLVTGSEAVEGRHDNVFGSAVGGPNVFHNNISINQYEDSGPHHRWSTGGLFDNITTDGELGAQNNWNWGGAHGWTGANMVFWNSTAEGFRVQNPPTAQNWVIGSQGEVRPGHFTNLGSRPGNYDAHGQNLSIDSLFEAQTVDAGRLGNYEWTGGSGNWSNLMLWNNYAVPAVRTIEFRDYLIGDVDGFTFDNNADDNYYIDPAFLSAIQSTSPYDVGGFDQLTGDRNVAFTQQFLLDSGDEVVHATLALGIQPLGSVWEDDGVLIDGVGRFAFNDLGWTRTAGEKMVGVLDLGAYLPLLQSGQLSINIDDNTAADFAILSLTVAKETPDVVGAGVRIANGAQVTIDSAVPSVGNVIVEGGSELLIAPGAQLQVIGDISLDALLQITGGSLRAGTIDDVGLTAAFNWTGGRVAVDVFGFDLVQQGGVLAPGDSPGTTSVDGSYDLLGGSYEIEIAALGNNDFVDVSGNATLAGLVDIELLDGYVPEVGDTFDILTATDITLLDGFLLEQPPGFAHLFTASTVAGGNGEVLRLTVLSNGSIPEPSTLAIAVMGIACLPLRRRRLRR